MNEEDGSEEPAEDEDEDDEGGNEKNSGGLSLSALRDLVKAQGRRGKYGCSKSADLLSRCGEKAGKILVR